MHLRSCAITRHNQRRSQLGLKCKKAPLVFSEEARNKDFGKKINLFEAPEGAAKYKVLRCCTGADESLPQNSTTSEKHFNAV